MSYGIYGKINLSFGKKLHSPPFITLKVSANYFTGSEPLMLSSQQSARWVHTVSSKKRTLPRSEAAMVAAADLGPITVHLDNYHLTFEDCQWTPDYDFPDMPENASCLEQELIQLRKEKRKMKKELDRFVCQAQEMKDLKERWNLLDFKYQLLLDMWTMKALDDKEGATIPGSTQGRRSSKSSPKRASGRSPSTRSSPSRNGPHDSPSKTRNGC